MWQRWNIFGKLNVSYIHKVRGREEKQENIKGKENLMKVKINRRRVLR
jgi:hypothetical protein